MSIVEIATVELTPDELKEIKAASSKNLVQGDRYSGSRNSYLLCNPFKTGAQQFCHHALFKTATFPNPHFHRLK